MTRTSKVVLSIALVLLGTVLLQQQTHFFSEVNLRPLNSASSSARTQADEFPWDKIPGLKKLKWYACYEGRECARLLVPMNYSDPDGEQYNLALIRKPALVPPESEFYRGPVLFNPGGPGGSGVEVFRGPVTDHFSTILGPQFDVLSFDPRGIAHSSPRANFFATDVERALWTKATDLSNTSDVAWAWARSRVVTQLAAENDAGHLRHINTPNTAHDMLRIVEAHGRSKIQYWGFSYGTVLGATFAAMFPDKIERFIIDGVVDSEDYYATLWSKALLDTEKAMDGFYTGCSDAGPDGCAFWAPTPEDIRQNLTTLLDSVRSAPIPIRTEKGYGLLDINLLRSTVFTALYFPYAAFPLIAQGLAELAAGSGKLLFDLANPPTYECACSTLERAVHSVRDSQIAVLCNDGVDVPDDLKSTQEYYHMMTNSSPWGDLIALITRMSCIGWPKFPKDHFQGPFIANTSHPMLLIGNTADPVTPLWAAKKMSKGFKESVVLTQDSVGHTSISAPSVCTQKYVREYFINGTLPEPGTICKPIVQPFPSVGMKASASDAQTTLSTRMAPEERDLFNAVWELSKSSAVVPFHGLSSSQIFLGTTSVPCCGV